jgi:branched-chain amino acid aminotransferase
VLEAPTSSIFWVVDGAVLTPPLNDHILASITRAIVIEVTGAREQPCTLEDLFAADEAFLASTTREVQPVAAVEDRVFEGTDVVTQRVASEVAAEIRSRLP